MAPFIYINGYPGVGKLTIAKELCKLLPNSKVISNHLLIDPVAAAFERTAPEYQPLRRALRKAFLVSISNSTSTKETTWIFTDQQSSDDQGSSVSKEYEAAAAVRGSPFISIILTCEPEENFRRATGAERGGGATTKLTDLSILREIREGEDIFHFGNEMEMELDVTELSATEASRRLFEHICKIS